jgi:hypothetical protein
MHTTKPLVPESSSFMVEIAIEKLKRCKLASIDEIPAELIQAGGNTLCSEIHNPINSIWNKINNHSSVRNLSLYLFIKMG